MNLCFIHFASETNPWIDFLVVVPEDKRVVAVSAIRETMDAFFQDGCDTPYGEMVAASLINRGLGGEAIVDFAILNDEETDTSEDWDFKIASLRKAVKNNFVDIF